ncbi:MAG: hypothetical protein KAJ19_05190 [Gammaproteobacteria bacterium]|nr:hypothetical protein [Gammaproteobacteria bacterium]
MYTAIFIGGEFDLTKRKLKDRRETVQFASMPGFDARLIAVKQPEAIDEVKILVYRHCGTTEKGVLIYELEGSA